MVSLLYLAVGEPHYSVYKHINDDHFIPDIVPLRWCKPTRPKPWKDLM